MNKDVYDVVKPQWISDSIDNAELAPLHKKCSIFSERCCLTDHMRQVLLPRYLQDKGD